MRTIRTVLILLAAIVAAALIPAASFAGARMSGKIVSIKGNCYTIEQEDGTKRTINLTADAKKLRAGAGGLTVGTRAVFNIISGLTEDPLLADTIMDSTYASQNASSAYRMPRNTNIGGFATAAGPAATMPASQNTIGHVSTGGGSANLTPSVNINAPFTASPMALNTPFTGEALTGGNPMPQTPNAPGMQQGGMNNPAGMQPGGITQTNTPMSPLNPQAPSGMFAPNQQSYNQSIQNQPGLNLSTGASPMSQYGGTNPYGNMTDPSSMITGTSKASNPSSMIFNPNDDDENEEDPLEALNPANLQAGGSPVQVTGKVMNCDMSKGVIFYMAAGTPGMQELGSATFSAGTVVIDGRTNTAAAIQSIVPGITVRIDGINQNGAIRATRITIIQ